MLLGLGATGACAAAELTVYRCESAAGVSVYSDQPCGAGTVLTLDVDGTQPPAVVDDSVAPQTLAGTRGTCPAPSASDLPGAVSAAFASGDVNRLASLYHWTGLTNDDARRMFGRFDDLLAQPLRNVGLGSAVITTAVPQHDSAGYWKTGNSDGETGSGAADPFASAENSLWLQLGPAQAPRQVTFRIVENAGCAWLRFG